MSFYICRMQFGTFPGQKAFDQASWKTQQGAIWFLVASRVASDVFFTVAWGFSASVSVPVVQFGRINISWPINASLERECFDIVAGAC